MQVHYRLWLGDNDRKQAGTTWLSRDIPVIFFYGSGWTRTSALARIWISGSPRTDRLEAKGSCWLWTSIWLSGWVTQPWSSSVQARMWKWAAATAAAVLPAHQQLWWATMMSVYIIKPLATKGTDTFLHGGQVKEAPTSEGESGENRIVFCISVTLLRLLLQTQHCQVHS